MTGANETAGGKSLDPSQCPLCGGPNNCQLCTMEAYKGPCWCATVEIPQALLALVPGDLRQQACICRECVADFHRTHDEAGSWSNFIDGAH